MNEIQILKSGLRGMHNLLDKALVDMTVEQWTKAMIKLVKSIA